MCDSQNQFEMAKLYKDACKESFEAATKAVDIATEAVNVVMTMLSNAVQAVKDARLTLKNADEIISATFLAYCVNKKNNKNASKAAWMETVKASHKAQKAFNIAKTEAIKVACIVSRYIEVGNALKANAIIMLDSAKAAKAKSDLI